MNYIISQVEQTVQEFLDLNRIEDSSQVFLDLKQYPLGKTNWDMIKLRYITESQLNENTSKYPSGSVIIPQGTPLIFQNSSQVRDSDVQIVDIESKLSELPAFISQKLADLLNDPNYQVKSQDHITGQVVASIDQNDATVYIWCRAINDWIDISHHITQINTSVTAAGGVFTLVIDDVEGYWDEFGTGKWEQAHNSVSIVKYKKDGSTKRPNFYHNTILAENDLVYIKLDKLAGESDDHHNDLVIKPAHKIWDMIGLIDTVTNQTVSNLTTTNVQGRDLIKLLIEDGSIFFTSQFIQNIFVDPDTLLAKRNLFTGMEQSLIYKFSSFKSVDLLLKYVVNKYSNLGIVPNSALYSYGSDLVKKKYELKSSSKGVAGGDLYDKLDLEKPSDREGLWQIIDFVFDTEPSQRLVSDPSFSQDAGSMINSIRKLCQEPFIEFRGDTYGDRYNFVVRKQPFDRSGYTGLIYGYLNTELTGDSLYSYEKKDNSKLKFKERELLRRDINNFKLSRVNTLSVYCIDIDDDQVLSHQLTFHDEAYSWYRLIPRGYGTLDESLEFALTPIVAFDEYAKIWGSRTLTIESNYTPATLLDDKNKKEQVDTLTTQCFLDLQYLIQSNAYLPFTRRGTITLTGNRTIKRGMPIFFKPTNEVFYVDSVSHSKTIGNAASENNRITTLQVSRGMVEPFIKGLRYGFGEDFEDVSYFNIINTEIESNASINSNDSLKNWKVNENVFNFFVQRRQFSYERYL